MARQKITETELNKMAVRGAKVTRRSSPVPSAAEVAESESRAPVRPSPELASAPPPVSDSSIPMASMAASMTAINKQLGDIVEHNSRVMEGMQDDIRRQMVKSPGRKPWRAYVKRDRTRLIDYVDLIPLETK